MRFSLRSLLLGMVLMGLALAVVRMNSSWVASTCMTACLILQWTAIVGAICRHGNTRVFWVAYAIFSFGYGLTCFQRDRDQPNWILPLYNLAPNPVNYSPIGPADLVDRLFQFVEVSAKVGDTVSARWQSGTFYPATVQQIADDNRMLVAWVDGTAPSWVTQIAIANQDGRIAGQSIAAIIIALLGGQVCQYIFRTKRPGHDDT